MGPARRLRAVLVRFGSGAVRPPIMTGVALAAVAALALAVVWAGRSGVPTGEEPGDVVRVGVVEGQTVDGYLNSSRRELAMLTAASGPPAGDTWALVSLSGYETPGRLPALLAGAAVTQVYARVPLPDARTQVSLIPVYRWPGDVPAGMLDAAVVRDREQADYLRLERGLTGDTRRERSLRETYGKAARIAAREAAAYRAGCACVFAAVVRASPSALDGIASRPGVRAVDPAPEVRGLDRTEFRPPLPEERGTVSAEPSAAPVPTTVPEVATASPGRLPSSIGFTVSSTSPARGVVGLATAAGSSPQPLAVPSDGEMSAAHDGSGGSSGPSGVGPGR
ncbi:hypothetical protein [Actinoplanes teichomyceticus]|uniref:Uncharacterized protein n=1 Tax=Actinoplanes teichomyceticus TaxID=1867 RepID=A0A561WJ49_ACTTI|nr:hypothetical protein [Actinoplanes teichomyceticus]TWG23895.1 hypothetical protein FHX34_102447 [Actinoplanes teichomyceticus]GIF11939.1 hypothetical protein Ate01nite_19710 [Actinoplanes teichomyceticus]